MKIGIIGGIFGDVMESFAESAPEKVLLRSFKRHGHQVETFPVTALPNAEVDLYHAHHFSQAAYYLALTHPKPLIFTSHSGFIISDYPFEDSALERFMRALVLRAADRVIALSRMEASVLEKKYGVNPTKIRVIQNGLPLDLYSQKTEHIHDGTRGELRLLSVGQLRPHKGHFFLLEALVEIIKKYPNIHLTLISHNAELSAEYLHYCRDRGIQDHVTFLGAKRTGELAQYYHACDVYVQPSLVESFGVTLAEAMACGKPVVATRVGGVEENVGRKAGILVPPRDSNALAQAILTLVENPNLRSEMGQEGKSRAESRYNDELFYQQHLDLYTEALAEKRALLRLPTSLGRILIWGYNHRRSVNWLKKLFPFLN